MSDQSTSLDLFHDIVEPAAAAWWPPAPGWRILLAVAALLAIVALLKGIAHWQSNRYRREALQLLRQLPAVQGERAADRRRLAAIAEVLKRTALTAYPREQVANLTSDDWFAFLDRTGGTCFSAGLGAAMEESSYSSASGAWQAQEFEELETQVRHWIKQHKVPVTAYEAPEINPSPSTRRVEKAAVTEAAA
jgi:hypothetical protein